MLTVLWIKIQQFYFELQSRFTGFLEKSYTFPFGKKENCLDKSLPKGGGLYMRNDKKIVKLVGQLKCFVKRRLLILTNKFVNSKLDKPFDKIFV